MNNNNRKQQGFNLNTCTSSLSSISNNAIESGFPDNITYLLKKITLLDDVLIC